MPPPARAMPATAPTTMPPIAPPETPEEVLGVVSLDVAFEAAGLEPAVLEEFGVDDGLGVDGVEVVSEDGVGVGVLEVEVERRAASWTVRVRAEGEAETIDE